MYYELRLLKYSECLIIIFIHVSLQFTDILLWPVRYESNS